MNKFFLRITPDESDTLLFLGIAAVFFGVYQLSIPISYIVLGVIFIAMSFVKAKAEVKPPAVAVID